MDGADAALAARTSRALFRGCGFREFCNAWNLKLLGDQRGVGTIEYALIASLISIAAVSAMANLGNEVDRRYTAVDTAVADSM